MIPSAAVVYPVRRVKELGIEVSGWKVDLHAVVPRKSKLAADSLKNNESKLDQGVHLPRGAASCGSEASHY
jgi:hypothetical protein